MPFEIKTSSYEKDIIEKLLEAEKEVLDSKSKSLDKIKMYKLEILQTAKADSKDIKLYIWKVS